MILKRLNTFQVRESLLQTMAYLADHDINTVVKMTPILDILTKHQDEVSDEAEVCITFDARICFNVFINNSLQPVNN